MASKKSATVGTRDIALLSALRMNPFTAEELLSLSATFPEPFTSVDYLQKRLRQLGNSGESPNRDDLVRWWPYATASRGMLHYYKLTHAGFRACFGDGAMPPRSLFLPIPLARQQHTRALAAFVVQAMTGAKTAGMEFTDFYPENVLRLPVGNEVVQPDCAFRLVDSAGKSYRFVVELDNGTERIRSTKDVESLERKVRLYEQHQRSCYRRYRYRVLFLAMKSRERVAQFLEVAAEQQRSPQHTLFYGAYLDDFLEDTEPLFSPRFALPHRAERCSLLPAKLAAEKPPHLIGVTPALC